jgi:hypothetical protein
MSAESRSSSSSVVGQVRQRVEAARDRFHAEAQASAALCLEGEAEGVAIDLVRMADASSGAGARGTKVLQAIIDQLGAPEPAPFVLAVAGDGSPIANALGALAHAVRTERIETGADDLAIGYPWLEGRLADGTVVRAPLFVYPATLSETTEGPWAWMLEVTGAPWLNEPLVALFRRLTRVRLTYEDFLAHDEDGLFRCDDSTWQGFVKTLQRGGVTLADTAKTMPPRPLPFEPMAAAGIDKIPPGQMRLSNHLVLGRFPMLAAGTAGELEALLATSLDGYSLASTAGLFEVPPDDPGLAGRAPGRAADDPGPFGPLRRWQVLPTDPWQDDALRSVEAMLGDNDAGLVVLGPPGTGRSQLIANLVAGAVQRGLKVLVTSPRRAALDDVAYRLAAVGLGEPLALVHDPWRDRSPLCNGIAESIDPIVSDLVAPPDLQPDTRALTTLEAKLSERLETADRAFDALMGHDGELPGLAELDEAALADDMGGLPDLSEWVSQVSRGDLEELLPEVQRLAPHAAPYLVPHPLADRTDWGRMQAREVKRFYQDIATLRAALETWALHKGWLSAPDLDRQRSFFQTDVRALVDWAEADDGAAFRRHAEVVSWLEGPFPEDVHTRFIEELRTLAATLTPVPEVLVALPAKELAERIANLDKLIKMEASGLRHFSPAFWSLKGLPQKLAATLPEDAPKEPVPLCALHREAETWHKLVALLPDEAAFRLERLGDPELVHALVAKLDAEIQRCWDEQRVVETVGALGFPERPEWAAWASSDTMSRAESPFLSALVAERERADALKAVYAGVERLKEEMSARWVGELRGLVRDRPAAAEGRLAALAGTEGVGLKVHALDQATAQLQPFVGRFLRVYAGPTREASRACRRAVEESWRALRIKAWGSAAIESSLVDPRELKGLAELSGQLEAARVAVAVGRWKLRVHGLTELESQRQDLMKLVNEAGRKRLRASLRQIVERYWKRGLSTLRPVWFAPLDAVASIFPRDRDTFDLIVIDEAHRASFGSALPALLRSRRVVALGDPCQAPPAIPATVPADDVAARDAYRSLLPLMRGVWPGTALWWAWGARREELWTFPNAAAYAGAVTVVPNAEKRARAKCEGLHWYKVDGRWQGAAGAGGGTNRIEADKIVELIAEVLADRIGEEVSSVGVIAFTVAQAALIRRLVDRRAARDEAFRAALRQDRTRPEHEQLVVGDLQSLPVDARDVMILSVTYATHETSKRLQTDYRQLAELDGENFLTDAITRARMGLYVVASFHDVALDAGRQAMLGPKILDALLGYTQGIALADDRIEKAALARLKAATGIDTPFPQRANGVGQLVRDLVAEPLVERGLGVSKEPMLGPAAPDMTVAPTQKSAARVAIQTTRFLQEADTLVRDLWSRRFWTRQGWILVRVTPGVWRASPAGVVRSLEKLFSLPPRADEKISAAAERRAAEERAAAEEAKRRYEEGLRWAAEAEKEAAARWAAEADKEAEAARIAEAEAEAARIAEAEAEAARIAEAEAEAARIAEAEAEAARIAEAAQAERDAAEAALMAEAERVAAAAAEAERVAAEAALMAEAERVAAAAADADRAMAPPPEPAADDAGLDIAAMLGIVDDAMTPPPEPPAEAPEPPAEAPPKPPIEEPPKPETPIEDPPPAHDPEPERGPIVDPPIPDHPNAPVEEPTPLPPSTPPTAVAEAPARAATSVPRPPTRPPIPLPTRTRLAAATPEPTPPRPDPQVPHDVTMRGVPRPSSPQIPKPVPRPPTHSSIPRPVPEPLPMPAPAPVPAPAPSPVPVPVPAPAPAPVPGPIAKPAFPLPAKPATVPKPVVVPPPPKPIATPAKPAIPLPSKPVPRPPTATAMPTPPAPAPPATMSTPPAPDPSSPPEPAPES